MTNGRRVRSIRFEPLPNLAKYSKKSDIDAYFFTTGRDVYVDRTADFVCQSDNRSGGLIIKRLEDHWGHEMSDPAKVAQVILQLSAEEQLPAHLLLGSDALHYSRLAEEKRESDAKAWHKISVSTDVADVKGLPDLKF